MHVKGCCVGLALLLVLLPSPKPYHGRPLTLGEIGCFMSHYNIWQVSRGLPFQVQMGVLLRCRCRSGCT